jgi:hypothetical protein
MDAVRPKEGLYQPLLKVYRTLGQLTLALGFLYLRRSGQSKTKTKTKKRVLAKAVHLQRGSPSPRFSLAG